jgi:hypothetical protein
MVISMAMSMGEGYEKNKRRRGIKGKTTLLP